MLHQQTTGRTTCGQHRAKRVTGVFQKLGVIAPEKQRLEDIWQMKVSKADIHEDTKKLPLYNGLTTRRAFLSELADKFQNWCYNTTILGPKEIVILPQVRMYTSARLLETARVSAQAHLIYCTTHDVSPTHSGGKHVINSATNICTSTGCNFIRALTK